MSDLVTGDDLNERRGDVTVVSRHMVSYPLAETADQKKLRETLAKKHRIYSEIPMVSFCVEIVRRNDSAENE